MPARDELAERNLECNYCGRLFRFKWQLSEHTRRHENKTPHKCNLCSKAFVKNSDLTTHLRSHSNEKLFKCKYCARPFKSKQGKLFHEDIHGFNRYDCPKCKEIFQSYWKLLKHKRIHKNITVVNNEISSFECSYCLVTFSTLEFKNKHEVKVHKKRTLDSDKIARKSVRELKHSKLIFRNKTFKSECIKIPPFSCSACAQTFPGSTSLSRHIKSEHPGEKLFYQQCNLCKKNISFNYFRPHIMSHYNIRPFVCKVCDAKFVRNHDLQHHMTTHSSLKPFVCQECHQKFQSIKCLAQHKKYHHSRVVYSCNICGKSFKKEASLKGHVMRIHCKSEHKVMCHMCNIEVFSFDIKNHVKRHHDTEKLLCEICGLAFRNVWTYKYHLRTCNNTNNVDITSIDLLLPIKTLTVVPCPHCSYLSKNASTFKRHCLKHHAEEIFNCIICSKKFLSKKNYKAHLVLHNLDLNLYIHDIALYECFFCGFIPMSYVALIEHLHSHEYFKWSLSWNNTNLSIGKSILASNDSDDFLFPCSDLSSLEIQHDSKNSINLFINIKDEISWIHDTYVKDIYKPKTTNFKYKSSNNSSKIKIKNENLTQQVGCKNFGALTTSVNKCRMDINPNENKPNLNNMQLELSHKSENQFSINKTEENCSERPFIYVDDLKKLNIFDLKMLLQNL